MADYYRLFMDIPEDDSFVEGEEIWLPDTPQTETGGRFPAGIFWIGKFFSGDTKLFMTVNSASPLDFTLNPHSHPVVSTRFADVVEHVDPGSIQRLPVTVLNREITNLEFMNVIRVIPVIDLERSEGVRQFDPQLFPEREGTIHHIHKIELKTDLNPDYHLFRPAEYTLPIIVSAFLRQILEDNKFTGMKFLDL